MKPLAAFLITAVPLCCLTSSTQAGRIGQAEEQARQQVEAILQQENAGKLTDRTQALKELIAAGHVPDEAYWQAGYVKRGNEWVSARNSQLTPKREAKLDEYTKVRSDYADSDEGQYKLARWCARHGFDDQANAHLKAVLLNNPENVELRRKLGYRKIGNQWIDQEDRKAAVREADRLAKELREWSPQVVKIRRGLNSSDPQRQDKAKVELQTITEVAAVPALEMILLPSSERGAAACVAQLCQIDHRRSSLALCKAAMFLPDICYSTKQVAIAELKTRPLKDFVPALLDQLSTSMSKHISCLARPDYAGNLYVLMQFVEESESRLSHDFLVKNEILVGRPGPVVGSHAGYPRNVSWGEVQEDICSLNKLGKVQLERIETVRRNRTRKAEDLLRSVTGISNINPEGWWSWWNNRNEYSIQDKPQRIQQFTAVEDAKEVYEIVKGHSCFVAGTPVWTDRGPRPIEELKVGDMALSKDVETGELAYRPIICTTIRHAKDVVTIDFGTEQITATKGHPFWVSGEAWVKARGLQQGQLVHTPTGVVKVEAVTPANTADVYNLIVDGFHTYFVGNSQALCHDISMAPPTDAVVPGLLNH